MTGHLTRRHGSAAPPSFCLVTSSVANSSCHQQQQRRNRKRNNSFWGRQRRESESIQGEEKNRDWASLHREEEGPFLTPGLGTTAVLSLHRDLRPPPSSTAIPPPSTLPTPAEPEREKRNRTEPRERKPGEEKNHSGKKKNHRSSLEPAEPSANHHRSFLHPDLEPPSTKKEEETLLTEGTKNRGRKQHSEAEERRRKTAASATVCHHRCPSRRPDHRHRRQPGPTIRKRDQTLDFDQTNKTMQLTLEKKRKDLKTLLHNDTKVTRQATGDARMTHNKTCMLPLDRNLHICRAEAAAAADGQPLFGEETDKPKFLGIELATFKKIIPLGLMFFCILFNYTILRDTKDVLVVTAKEAFADKLLNVLGPRFLGPLAIMRIWTFCLFYVMAELWGSVVVSVLFWGFANQITTVDEAKRFYPLFGLGANVALIFSGRTVKYFSNLRKNLGPGVDGWAVSLKGMMSIVVLMGLAICLCYWWVNTFVPLPTRSLKKKEKPKMSTMESLKFLVSSRYIRDLATLVVAYGISINLVEVTWKSKLKAQFPSPNEYSAFMGDFSTATGIATFSMMLLSQFIFDKYGWGVAAKITPTVLLLTGVGFFSLILFGGPLAPTLTQFGMTPLLAAVYVGAMQNIFSKSAKYSLFDPCKEMAYIPLDEDTKVKGKAAIDVVCNPLGKSGGALIQQFMILTFGSLANSTPYLGGILLVIVFAWLGAAKSLDTQFTALRQEEELEKEMERAAVKIPVVSQEGGNGALSSGTALNPTTGDPSSSSSEPSSPRNI
uniref:ADP,ATP carrier protein n=1 Tax=Populus trichocarpa TaxID=3694 RepID=Q0ZCE3_POPTR|nr:plastid ATP/ADP-transporter [Populus trichocarpa]